MSNFFSLAICRTLPILLFAAAAPGQETVAPTDERVGRVRGSALGEYNLTQSWELGTRFRTIDGNEGKYRSDVNFGNGLRLLGAQFSLHSTNGRGLLFDELSFSSQGLGNDPYGIASVRASKNRIYNYDMVWRTNAYYNPALPVSFGQHLMDTTRNMQDHDVTIFPQSKIRFFAGFSRVVQEGAAFSTAALFDLPADEFPVFMNVRRRQNEYRFGNEVQFLGFRLNWMYALEKYSEDSPLQISSQTAGNQGTDPTVLDRFLRSERYSGDTPSWRVNLFREHSRRWAVNGRFTNSAGRRDFLFDESAVGADRFGARNRQILVGGNARRPVTTAALTLSFFPTEGLTISNHTSLHSTRMEGDSGYRELENASLSFATVNFQYLGIRRLTNVSDLNWRLTKWFQVHGGYQFAVRDVRSIENVTIEGFDQPVAGSQTNRLHAGIAGFRLQPLKPLTIGVDAEIGRQDHPFTPTSDKDYHGFNSRAVWKQKTFRLSAISRVSYNTNSVSLAAYSARNRHTSFDGSWTPKDWFSIDAGYSKLHTDTASWLSYFISSQRIIGDQSIYISNLHSAHLAAHVSILQRVDLSIGYSRSQDTGDGRAEASVPPAGAAPGAQLAELRAVQTFPMTFESPFARISVRLHTKLRWNVGYQPYRYREEFATSQNYRAHTGYTSLLWSF